MIAAYVFVLALLIYGLLAAFSRRHREPAPREIGLEEVEAEAAKGGYSLITTVFWAS